MNLVRTAVPLPGRSARVDREIVIDDGEGARRRLARVPGCRVGLERARRPRRPNWYGIRYDRLEEDGIQWPCTDLDHPGTPFLHAPRPARPSGEGKFFPVE